MKHAPADLNNLVATGMAKAVDGNVNPARADLHSPQITAQHLKVLAEYVGAEFVGIVRSEAADYPFAIVCGVPTNHDPGEAPGIGGQMPAVNTQYVSFMLAAYIRELGYRATAAIDPAARTLAARAGLPATHRVHVAE